MTATIIPLTRRTTPPAPAVDEAGLVFGPRRSITTRPDVGIITTCVRRQDGSIDTSEPVGLFIECGGHEPITADQARQLAARLLEAATELDNWIR